MSLLQEQIIAYTINTDEDLLCICTINIWAGRKTRVHQTAGKTPAIFIIRGLNERIKHFCR